MIRSEVVSYTKYCLNVYTLHVLSLFAIGTTKSILIQHFKILHNLISNNPTKQFSKATKKHTRKFFTVPAKAFTYCTYSKWKYLSQVVLASVACKWMRLVLGRVMRFIFNSQIFILLRKIYKQLYFGSARNGFCSANLRTRQISSLIGRHSPRYESN